MIDGALDVVAWISVSGVIAFDLSAQSTAPGYPDSCHVSTGMTALTYQLSRINENIYSTFWPQSQARPAAIQDICGKAGGKPRRLTAPSW
jgi:hypothetical protein